MKKKVLLSLAILLVASSCDGPETTVTNIVRRDGSVLRKVEMCQNEKEFLPAKFRVPVDETWNRSDSISISAKGDTTWFLLAEKIFKSAEAINSEYTADTAVNRGTPRSASFRKSFRWFTTRFTFSETCGKSLHAGYPPDNFLKPDQIIFYRLPSSERKTLLAGPDSLEFRKLSHEADSAAEVWFSRSFVSDWIRETYRLTSVSGKDTTIKEHLLSLEDKFFELPDTLNFPEVVSSVCGDSIYCRYRTEMDSAVKVSEKRLDRSLSFREYTMKISMPDRIISTNGYLFSSGEVTWPVRGELFLSDDYVMQVTSRRTNYWAVLITLLLPVILLAALRGGLMKKKG